uniref:Uncharacterized protein n=1 Tax=Arundo donax TaxID=35708 RepID=A0A0A9BGT2_ARUDO
MLSSLLECLGRSSPFSPCSSPDDINSS